MRWLLISIAVLFLCACSPEKSSAKKGEILFNKKHIGKNNVVGCVACHSIQPNQIIVGPSLAGLKLRAAYLVAGESTQEYIKNAIINPDAYIVNGFLPAVMYSHYAQDLSQEEINSLVDYLSLL